MPGEQGPRSMALWRVAEKIGQGASLSLWVNGHEVGPITNLRRVGESFEFTAGKDVHKKHRSSTIYVTWG